MRSMRNTPQPRAVCKFSSLASRFGPFAVRLDRGPLPRSMMRTNRRSFSNQTWILTGISGSYPLPCSMAFIVDSATAVLSLDRRCPDRGSSFTASATFYITGYSIRLQGSLEISHPGLGSLQGDEGDVVLLLRVRSREAGQFGQQDVDELFTATRALGHDQPPKTREAEHVAFGVVSFHQPIAVEQEIIARGENGFFFLVRHVRHQAERHAPRSELLFVATPLRIGGSWPALA